jgi:NitT/TauT family transport system permease protein
MKDSSILFTGASADDGRDQVAPPIVEQPARQNRRRAGRVGDWVARHPALAAFPFVLGAALLLWEAVVRWQGYPVFILPRPGQILQKALTMSADGSLLRHTQATVTEIGVGLLIGLTMAFALGYWLGRSRTLDRILSPYLVASQTVPVVAIAPLLVIWFGSGLLSKVLVTAIMVFFPTLLSTVVGIRNVDPDLRELMRSLRASRWQLFLKLDLPGALPVIFGGLKLSVILAVVGAIVGEFVGADEGLGFLINLGRGVLDTSLIFVAVLMIVLLAQAMYWSITLLESHLLRWKQHGLQGGE